MMSHEEKTRLYRLADEARERGDFEEAESIIDQIPLDPDIAMIAKKVSGSEYLKNSGLNLTDAEEFYGKDWLDK